VLHSPLLRGYWPLENSAVDASGRGNNGTLVGGAGYTRGKLGQGIHLASGGSNDYFTASCEDAKFGSNPFTVSLWVYPTSFSGERALYDALVLGGAGARANAFVLVQVATTGKLRIFTAGSYGTSSLGALTLNAWNHIALKRTGNTAYYYINGNLDTNTTTLSTNITSGGLICGRYADSAAGYFDGDLDEISIWHTNLTNQNIKRIMMGLHRIP